ncbi:nucleic acid/nucleotide deaminase domain-containing protein [Streptomyces mirabilis]|uniref:nucleic acid/nucleotide deaminase domain-containing protein n=1 Tax=Streptomyces mirabilis TaxID=68239 RepID=UPI0036C950BB
MPVEVRHCSLDLLLEGLKGIFNVGVLAHQLVLVVDRLQCGHQTSPPLPVRLGVRILSDIPLGLHSEELIVKELEEKGFNKNQIKELYSERSPCPDKCSPLMECIPVTYSTPDGPGSAQMIKYMLDTFERGKFTRSTQPNLSE